MRLQTSLLGERELFDPMREHRVKSSTFTLPMGRTLLFPVRGTEATARRYAPSFVIQPACPYPGLQVFSGAFLSLSYTYTRSVISPCEPSCEDVSFSSLFH